MTASENFDRFRVGAITSDLAMVMTISADQISQHFRVARIGLRSRDIMAFAITGD